MKLYSSRVAPNPHKIRLAIAELGIPCEVVEIDLKDRPNRRPPFTTTLNPNGHLPVIDDDGFVLWESDAILAYLGRKHADRGLWPTGLKEEADALRWLLYELATLQPPVADVWWEKWLRPKLTGKSGDEEKAARGRENAQKPLRVLDGHLTTRPYMLGERFTLVDCAYAAVLNMLHVSDVSFESLPHLRSYFGRLQQRESFRTNPLVPPGA